MEMEPLTSLAVSRASVEALPPHENQDAREQRQDSHEWRRQHECDHPSEPIKNQPNREKQHSYISLEGDRHSVLLLPLEPVVCQPPERARNAR